MNRQEFCEKLAELGLRLAKVGDQAKRAADLARFVAVGEAFLKAERKTISLEPIIKLGEALLRADERPLKAFVGFFVADPNGLRWQLLGRSALRRKELSPIRRRALDVIGREPDLFGPVRGRFDERLHTEVIAWALDPGTKRLASRPLERFMRRVELLRAALGYEQPLPFSMPMRSTTKVTPELVIAPHGRVDICVESDEMLLLIEAKILAGEGDSQLPRYQAAAAQRSKGRPWSVIFLTANAEQKPSVTVPHLTLRDLLADWLLVAAEGDSPDHEYLRAYLASVARVVGVGGAGDFDDWDFYTRRRALDLLDAGVSDE